MSTFKRFSVFALVTFVMIACSKQTGVVGPPKTPANTNTTPTDGTSTGDTSGGLLQKVQGTWTTGCISYPGDTTYKHIVTYAFGGNSAAYNDQYFDFNADPNCGTPLSNSPAEQDYTFTIGPTVTNPSGANEFDLTWDGGTYYDIIQYSASGPTLMFGNDDEAEYSDNDGSSPDARVNTIDTNLVFKPQAATTATTP